MKPILINNLDLAKNKENITGEIAVSQCERLAGAVDQSKVAACKIHYSLIGSTTKFHLPSLSLTINTELPVICQRCLEPMTLEIEVAYDYVISNEEPAEFDGDDDVDWLEATRNMNVEELVEDELLMAMPLAPTHKHTCKPLRQESGEKHNPFSVLKGLIK